MADISDNQVRARARYVEARTTPYRAMHMGRPKTPVEGAAARRMMRRLNFLHHNAFDLPSNLLRPIGGSGAFHGYGPYEFGTEMDDEVYGRMTDVSVRKFQDENKLGVDGKAGMGTLSRLDFLISNIKAHTFIEDE